MNDETTSRPPRLSAGQILKFILGIIAFGVLMGIRTEFEQIWVRALIAACAGGILGWAFLQARKN